MGLAHHKTSLPWAAWLQQCLEHKPLLVTAGHYAGIEPEHDILAYYLSWESEARVSQAQGHWELSA